MLTFNNAKWLLLAIGLLSLLLLVTTIQRVFCESLTYANSQLYNLIGITLCLSCIVAPPIIGKAQHFRTNWGDKDSKIHGISLIVFSIIIVCTICSKKFGGDDNIFKLLLEDRYLPQFLSERYQNWSSRVVIEAFFISISNAVWCWRIFTSIIIICIFESIVTITLPKEKKKYAVLIYVLFFLIPTKSLHDAGWAATTMNYLWPLAAAMPAFLILAKLVRKERISLYEYVYSIPLLFYATNSEQMALLTISSFGLYMAYCFIGGNIEKKKATYCCLPLAIGIVALLLILNSPGNDSRMEREISNYFHGFSQLGFPQKIELGFISTMPFFYCSKFEHPINYILPVVMFICTLVLIQKGKKKVALMQIPGLLLILFNHYIATQVKLGNIPNKELFLFSNVKLPEFSVFSETQVYIEIAVYIGLTSLLLFTVFQCFQTTTKAIIAAIVLMAGLCTRLTMGFSPTIYASEIRPFTLMMISMFVVCGFLIAELTKERDITKKEFIKWGLIIVAYTMTAYLVTRHKAPTKVETFYDKNGRIEQTEAPQADAPEQYSSIAVLPDMPTEKTTNKKLNEGVIIEFVNKKPVKVGERITTNGDDLKFEGWAMDFDNNQPIAELYVIVGNKTFIAQSGIERYDVKNAFNTSFENLGFKVLIPSSDLKGVKTIQFVKIKNDKTCKFEPITVEMD